MRAVGIGMHLRQAQAERRQHHGNDRDAQRNKKGFRYDSHNFSISSSLLRSVAAVSDRRDGDRRSPLQSGRALDHRQAGSSSPDPAVPVSRISIASPPLPLICPPGVPMVSPRIATTSSSWNSSKPNSCRAWLTLERSEIHAPACASCEMMAAIESIDRACTLAGTR